MYWRIDCTEHLVLNIRDDPAASGPPPRSETNGSNSGGRRQQQTRAGGRPRSTTYSPGSIISAQQNLAGKHHSAAAPSSRDDLSDSPAVVRWAGSPDGYLLAGVTQQGVYLWLVKPFVQLSSLVYDPVEELGQFVDVIWGGDTSSSSSSSSSSASLGDDNGGDGRRGLLFAVTSMGYIYEIAVYERDAPALEYQFAAQHYYVRGPGEADGIAALGLAQKRTYRLPGAGAAVCAAAAAGAEMAMVATRSHVFRLTWAGVVVSTTLVCYIHDSPLHTGGLQHSDPITHDSPLHTGELQHNPSDSIVHDSPAAAQVRQMLRVPVRGAAVWAELFLFSDGTVRVLSGDGSAHMLPGAAFTVLAYSAASGVVAAGTAGSEVLLYALGGGEGPAPALLAQWTLGHDRTARVTALAWAPDGAALACGYSTGHVVLRTALGLELNATRLGSSAKQAAAAAAVAQPRLLHWAPGATRLYVLSDCVAAGGARCGQQGDVLPLARAAGGEGGARRVCLYADDKVLLHHGDFYGQQQQQPQQQQQQRGDPGADLPPPELLWHVAHVPPAYIGANWPLRHVAADADGQHVAVAGRRGVACYSVAAQRWRLLRNRQQEAALACEGGLLWHREHLVVACANHACGGAPQLLFFARARPLDTAGDVQAVALAAPAVTMSCHDSELLVLCRNNVVYQYALFDALGVVQVSLRRAASLAQAGVDARRVRSLQWVPSALFDARPAFLVHEGIELKVVSVGAKEGQPPSVAVVSGRVEFTITSGVNFGNMHSTVWWFSGSHLYAALISLEDFMEGGVGALVDSMEGGARHSHRHRHRRHVLRIRPEFFPVAISADRGMAVGIDQDWTLEEHAVIGLAKLPVRAKLYLHNILDHMLSDGAEQDALMYAACFEHLEFFPHAMEILLHEVLEREMDHFHQHRQHQLAVSDDATESDDAVVSDGAAAAAAAAVISDDAAVLPRVVALLENFSAFHEIVVHCARKTEAAFWSHLFACVGGPEKFFRQCLNNNELETATQSLIILQTLEPASVNEDNILALLAKVVAAQNKDLCLEILRFVKMTSESDPTMKRLLTRLHKS